MISLYLFFCETVTHLQSYNKLMFEEFKLTRPQTSQKGQLLRACTQ